MCRKPPSIPQSLLLLALLPLLGCGPRAEHGQQSTSSAPGPSRFDHDQVDKQVAAVEEGPLTAFSRGLLRQEPERMGLVLSADFEGELPPQDSARVIEDGQARILEWSDEGLEQLAAEDFCMRLLACWTPGYTQRRRSFRLERFRMEPDAAAARGRGVLHVAGEGKDGERRELSLSFELDLVKSGRMGWQIRRAVWIEGRQVQRVAALFRDVTQLVGFDTHDSPENREMAQLRLDDHRTLALGGLSAVDWDGDGFQDLISTRRGQQTVLMRNDGQGGFVPEELPVHGPVESGAFLLVIDLDGDGRPELVNSEPLGYGADRSWLGIHTRHEDGNWEHRRTALSFPNAVGVRHLAVQTVVPFDAEGDGDLDLFVAVYGDGRSRGKDYNTIDALDGADNHLFINQGGLKFTEESAARGIHGTRYTYVAQAFDFDRDGDLDLFEGNDFGPNVLWLNDGEGRFTADTQLGFGGVPTYSMGASLADFDNTGQWSLYVSNMSSAEGQRMVPVATGLSESMRSTVETIASGNKLYTETASGGAWRENAREAGCNLAGWAWGSIFADFDNDTDKDLFVTNGFTSHRDPALGDWQRYYWRQVLSDARALEDGRRAEILPQVAGFRGSFNGYERDRYFHNPDGVEGRFVEAAYSFGIDADHDGRSVVPVDVDGDGDLDLALWTLQGLRLYENLAGGHFLRVVLESPRGQAGCLGARVQLESGGVTQQAQLSLVEGFQSQLPAELHFGLGDAPDVARVNVHWPDGTRESWTGLPGDRRIVLTQGAREARVEELNRWPESSRPKPSRAELDTIVRRPDGGSEALGRAGRITLARFVGVEGASDPWPGVDELLELHADLDLALVALNTGAMRRITAANLPDQVRVLMADRTLLELFFGGSDPIPDPCTFLFDIEGELCQVVRRPIANDELSPILKSLEVEPGYPVLLLEIGRMRLAEARYREARDLFQRALEGDQEMVRACDGLAQAQRHLNRPELSEEAYRRAVTIDPDYSLGHYNLGSTLLARGRHQDAIESFEQALRIDPADAKAWLSLGEVHLILNQLDEALTAFGQASELEPDNGSLLTTRGKILAKAQRYAEAKDMLERALELDPDDFDAQRALRRVRELLGE